MAIRSALVCMCLMVACRGMGTESQLRVLEPDVAEFSLGESKALRGQLAREDELGMLPAVPEDVECYHALVEKVDETVKALAELEDRAHVAMVKYNHTSELKESSVVAVAKLEQVVVDQKAAMDEIKKAYEKDHIAALSVYELARGALNRYNDLKKQGEDDATLSQEEMAAYLKYKEMALKATEEGKKENTKRYESMSEEHLATYKKLEKSIKKHLDNAKEANTDYQKLSDKYDDASKTVSALEVEVTHKTKEYEATDAELEHQKAIYTQAVDDSTLATAEFQEVQHKVTQTKNRLKDTQAEQLVANTRFHGIDKKLKRLKVQEEGAISKMGKYREIAFQFETKAKKMGEQAASESHMFQTLREKHKVMESVTQAFSLAYEHAGCGVMPHEAAARAQQATEMETEKEATGMAFQLADEQLEKAKKLRDAAMADAAEDAKEAAAQKEASMGSRKLLTTETHEQRLVHLSAKIRHHAAGKHKQASTRTLRRLHAKHMLLAQQGVVNLLQQSTSDDKGETVAVCEQTKQLGSLDFNAMEEAALERDRHKGLEMDYRKKEASNLSGITSTSVILKNLETKVANVKAQVTITAELRKNPCEENPEAAIKSSATNTTNTTRGD